jgi:hypothetical protein
VATGSLINDVTFINDVTDLTAIRERDDIVDRPGA